MATMPRPGFDQRAEGLMRANSSRAAAPRVGLFGLLGSGNSGNDASMETVLAYLREAHPDAVVDALCGGPEVVRSSYGIDAAPVFWYQRFEERATGAPAAFLKVIGKGVDAYRTASWVRRHDAVIVPGAGALETTLPQRAWGFPYALLVLAASGRLFRTRVALVSVGADHISKRPTRWVSNTTARLVSYRSYRDAYSRDSMRQRGIDTSSDPVCPDLVFGVPVPPYEPGDPRLVGVGVMAYYGGNDDRKQADQIHSRYVETMTEFTGWLVDNDYRIRLFGGDKKFDVAIAEQIQASLLASRPGLDASRVTVAAVATYPELVREMAPVGMVVATRYHNVMCALKLCKPTISVGYSRKFISLMSDMGLAEFHQFADSVDTGRLIEQFKKLEGRRAELEQRMVVRNAVNKQGLANQFATLSGLLLPGSKPARTGDPQVVAPLSAARTDKEVLDRQLRAGYGDIRFHVHVGDLQPLLNGLAAMPVIRGREAFVDDEVVGQVPPEIVERLDVAECLEHPPVPVPEVRVGNHEPAAFAEQFRDLSELIVLAGRYVLKHP
jgi:polysaccharide pyruvyl transferase WcaK-like protein